jgi:RimJ/RimL family protein N-acetyltransferase
VTLVAVSAGPLSIVEPTAAEVEAHAALLSAWYSHPDNMRLMTAADPMTPAEVVEFYRDGAADGDRLFFVYDRGELVGDADFRNIRGDTAEFAIMIGPGQRQGRGLGTTAGAALHHFGFLQLGLRSVVLSVSPANHAAIKSYRKLGYEEDRSPGTAAFAEHPDDLTMSVTAERFYRLWPEIGAQVTILAREKINPSDRAHEGRGSAPASAR